MADLHYRHYINTDDAGNITRGFSDAFRQPGGGDILINGEGGYQFRLWPDGEENPSLYDEYGICLYKYIGGGVVQKTDLEIQAEIAALPVPEPQIDPITQLQLAIAELAEMIGGT